MGFEGKKAFRGRVRKRIRLFWYLGWDDCAEIFFYYYSTENVYNQFIFTETTDIIFFHAWKTGLILPILFYSFIFMFYCQSTQFANIKGSESITTLFIFQLHLRFASSMHFKIMDLFVFIHFSFNFVGFCGVVVSFCFQYFYFILMIKIHGSLNLPLHFLEMLTLHF